MKHLSYHVTFDPPHPTVKHWPNGFWAVYAIDGDQIAKRICFDEKGAVVRRDSWCGYLGGAGDFEGVAKLIAEHKARAI